MLVDGEFSNQLPTGSTREDFHKQLRHPSMGKGARTRFTSGRKTKALDPVVSPYPTKPRTSDSRTRTSSFPSRSTSVVPYFS